MVTNRLMTVRGLCVIAGEIIEIISGCHMTLFHYWIQPGHLILPERIITITTISWMVE